MPQAREELEELVAIRSVADPRQFPPEECAAAAQWVLSKFSELGFSDVRLAETADGSQAVVGSRPCSDGNAPTVLLYAHYDVQPPLNEAAWRTPPFQLTEVDGRWYGRGAADCKGNIVVHLAAARAGRRHTGQLEAGCRGIGGAGHRWPGGLRAQECRPAACGCDPGVRHRQRGRRTACGHREPPGPGQRRGGGSGTEVEVHSGMFGGPAPDALAALVAMLATLRDDKGNTTITGLDNTQRWTGELYPPEQFRSDAGVLDGASLLGDGSVSDMLWARPAVTILGIDCPPVLGSTAAIVPAAARLNLRIPPGMAPDQAHQALVDHLHAVAPWGVQVTVDLEAEGAPFRAAVDGPAYEAIASAMKEAYGAPMSTLGQGGSIRCAMCSPRPTLMPK